MNGQQDDDAWHTILGDQGPVLFPHRHKQRRGTLASWLEAFDIELATYHPRQLHRFTAWLVASGVRQCDAYIEKPEDDQDGTDCLVRRLQVASQDAGDATHADEHFVPANPKP
jgi:hypothetical protein